MDSVQRCARQNSGSCTDISECEVASSTISQQVVPPQPVCDRSLIDSVAGFINEVTLNNTVVGDSKDSILWARFETADINEPSAKDEYDADSAVQPLLLILGYGSGIQVWAVPANGEATEVLAWRQGTVRVLRILPSPKVDIDCPVDQPSDQYEQKRPLVAICDNSGSGPQYCSVNFVSLKDGDQVKKIKFNNPILDIMANQRVLAITFVERIAVFEASTLEHKLIVTTCYPSPGINQNPISLGTRWLAYAEKKLINSKRSSGGCDGEGSASYTATVLHAAKSLGKGLRGLGETVASSLSGTGNPRAGFTPINAPPSQNHSDSLQAGVVTILDLQCQTIDASNTPDPMVAHFVAHNDPVVAMMFDMSGMLLVTADKRGHDFHVFRIQPHPGGPSLAAVHHLYVLHRGDTSAKVQDIAFASDSRWVAVSTLRGTTHVFPITPYGGPVGVRTHGSPHVVNRLSRFHRSAGLAADGRSNSPITLSETPIVNPAAPYNNPRIPPFPHPTVIQPLAQIRQPISLSGNIVNNSGGSLKSNTGRQRIPSYSEDSPHSVRVCATFASARAYLLDATNAPRDHNHRTQQKVAESLFIMACHGAMLQYDLEPRPLSGLPKEKICDDTAIELEVEPKAQWPLMRQHTSMDIQPPLSTSNLLLKLKNSNHHAATQDECEERWLSQVEIVTHAGPHRRLWMGPQFMFKTYNTSNPGSCVSLMEADSVEVACLPGSRPARSNPVNMPGLNSGQPLVPVLIEAGSCSSFEQSPRLLEGFQDHFGESNNCFDILGDSQLKEDLADAMKECPGIAHRDSGRPAPRQPCSVNVGENACETKPVLKIVNPVGTVMCLPSELDDPAESKSGLQEQNSDQYIHENCDEALFRPVITGCNVIIDTIDPAADDVCLRDKTVTVCINESTEEALLKSAPIIKKNTNDEYDKKAEENLRHAEEEKILEDLNYEKQVQTSKIKVTVKSSSNAKAVNDTKKMNGKRQKNKGDNNAAKKDIKRNNDVSEKSEKIIRDDKVNVITKPVEDASMSNSIKYQGLKPEEINFSKDELTENSVSKHSACNSESKDTIIEEIKPTQTVEELVEKKCNNSSDKLNDNINDDIADTLKSELDFPALKPKPRQRRSNKKTPVETTFTVVEEHDLKDVNNKASIESEELAEQPSCDAVSQSIIEAEIISTHNSENTDEEVTRFKNKIPYDSSNLVVAFCVEPNTMSESTSKLDFELAPEKMLEIDDALDNCSVDLNVAGQQDSDYKSLDTEVDDMYMSMDPEHQMEKLSQTFEDKIIDDVITNEDFIEIERKSVEKVPELSTDSDDSEKLLKDLNKKSENIVEEEEIWSSKIENVENNPVNVESKTLPVVQNDTKQSSKRKNKKKKKN